MRVLFIHGMCMTPRCWEGFRAHFQAAGIESFAPAWPGRDLPPAQLRARHPDRELGMLTLPQIVQHYERIVRESPTPLALVGHSMGGLLVQLLLQRGLGTCGVAISSAPPQGVFLLSLTFLRNAWPVLNPLVSGREPLLMSPEQFADRFANTLPSDAQLRAYDEHITPESRQVGRAALTAASRVDFAKPRAPLLFIAGGSDRAIPAALNRANFSKYSPEAGITDYREFAGRSHFICNEPGWEEIATEAQRWVCAHPVGSIDAYDSGRSGERH